MQLHGENICQRGSSPSNFSGRLTFAHAIAAYNDNRTVKREKKKWEF